MPAQFTSNQELGNLTYQLNSRWFWFCQFLVWGGLALTSRWIWLDSQPPSWLWVLSYSLLGMLYSSLLYLIIKLIPVKKVSQQIFLSIIAAIVLGLIWRLSFNSIEYHGWESRNNDFHFWGYLHNGKSSIVQLIIWVLAYWLVYFYQISTRQLEIQQQLQLENRSAQLVVLQQQVNPHFLFNVLASLDTLMLKGEITKTRAVLAQFTSFLRVSLTELGQDGWRLESELKLINDYLQIEKLRFADKLIFNVELDLSLNNMIVPVAITLPIIENCIKYGNSASGKEGRISIKVQRDDHYWTITVVNDYPFEKCKPGLGIGLENVKQRLSCFYQQDAQIEYWQDSEFFTVRLKLPRYEKN